MTNRKDVAAGRRVIVDAMNVIGSRPDGWWKDRDRAMRDFARAVDAHACETGEDITIVFDTDPGPPLETDHVDVVIALRRGANAADYEIERLVAEEPDRGRLLVVTSDRALTEAVTAAGAEVTSSGAFRAELER